MNELENRKYFAGELTKRRRIKSWLPTRQIFRRQRRIAGEKERITIHKWLIKETNLRLWLRAKRSGELSYYLYSSCRIKQNFRKIKFYKSKSTYITICYIVVIYVIRYNNKVHSRSPFFTLLVIDNKLGYLVLF